MWRNDASIGLIQSRREPTYRRESERNAERLAQEAHERRSRAAHVGELLHEAGRRDGALRQLRHAYIALALEVVDQRVLGVYAGGRTLVRLATQHVGRRELPSHRALPARRVGADRRADALRRRRVRAPDAHADERIAGLQV